MSHTVLSRLEAFRQQRRVQAGSLILTVFGDAILPRGGRIWLGSLIRLLEPLALNERLIRTAIFRLTRAEWLHTESVGRRADYALTAAGRRRFVEAARQIYAARAPLWDCQWRLLLAVGQLAPPLRDKVRKALAWQGFGLLGADCFVHPGADLPAVLDALVAEGLEEALGALLPLCASDPRIARSASNADLVGRAWDLNHLGEAYGRFVALYTPIAESLHDPAPASISDRDAFLLRTLLIHDYRRLLLRDPELPEVLLPPGWPGQRARRLCATLYRRLEAATDRHLGAHLCLACGRIPEVETGHPARFRDAGEPPALTP